MTRQADVYYRKQLAGRLIELAEGGCRFVYDEAYLEVGKPVSLTLPLRAEPYESPAMLPFFAGLVPEGWYLKIVSRTLKVDERDLFGLLLSTCADCVGAVSLQEAEDGLD